MPDEAARVRLSAVLLSAAIFVAPFIALVFSTAAGLVVMAVALGVTSALALDAVPAIPPRARQWVRVAVVVNLGLAVACGAVAVWLVAGS